MTISLAITTYNRYDLTIESFAQVIDDPRIDDIVVLDDASTDGSYEKLGEYYKDIEKVRVIRQAQNRGMSINKRDAIAYAKNAWAIIFDSDNIIGPDYLDAIERTTLIEDTIYCPTFAKPTFDYRLYNAQILSKENAKHLIRDDKLNMALNTCNYIVPRDNYLKFYKFNKDHIASDTIWFNYNWLSSGNNFYFVSGLEYEHRVHDGSGFMQNASYNMAQSEKVRKMIMVL